MGTPDPAFNFGRILAVMLRQQYPGVQFEVVNGAMTAINSHVALRIEPDYADARRNLEIARSKREKVLTAPK